MNDPKATPSVSSGAFRDALAQFASGVTVVAANGPDGPVGFTATGFTSVSLSPPLILVCVAKIASAYSGVVGAAHFGVSILEERQAGIGLQFARKNVDRFAGVSLRRGASVPLVEGALAHLACETRERYDAGDHTILVGHVVEASALGGRPLLHFVRTFGTFMEEAPAADVPASAAAKLEGA